MFADQRGPEGKQGSLHARQEGFNRSTTSQLVLHGPVWYTDDVLGFLESRQSEPLYQHVPAFLEA